MHVIARRIVPIQSFSIDYLFLSLNFAPFLLQCLAFSSIRIFATMIEYMFGYIHTIIFRSFFNIGVDLTSYRLC